MGKPSILYTVCLLMFPVAFTGFVVGFGCPVWVADSNGNSGLWQACAPVFKDCNAMDFDIGGDWMIGVRSVEIFALVMLSVAAAKLLYENCCGDFSGRNAVERIFPGVFCVLGGLGGLSGIIVYAIKQDDAVQKVADLEFGWAMMLLAAASGLAFVLGTGFLVSGVCLEKLNKPADKVPINAFGPGTPYMPSPSQGGESYEMTTSSSNKALINGRASGSDRAAAAAPSSAGANPLPGHALFNGLSRSSVSGYHDPYSRGAAVAGPHPGSQYYTNPAYSASAGEEPYPPQFDLSEGYLPASRARSGPQPQPQSHPSTHHPQPADSSYYLGREDGGVYHPHGGRARELGSSQRGEDPYLEDPYYARAGGRRAGMEEGYNLGGGRGDGEMRSYDGYDDRRDNFYRAPRF